jgi:hypothetical protein
MEKIIVGIFVYLKIFQKVAFVQYVRKLVGFELDSNEKNIKFFKSREI